MMKNIATLAVIGLFILLCAALPQDANAQFSISQPRNSFSQTSNSNQQNKANITFKNSSDYTMTIRVLYLAGGLYSVVELPAHSSRTLYFNSSNTFKMKILASKGNEKSYHDGGELSVTCNSFQWTEGEITFQLSSYGDGLGPCISAQDFWSNN